MAKRILILLLVFSLLALGLLLACSARGKQNGNAGGGGNTSGQVYYDENANQDCDGCDCGIAEVNIQLYADSCGGTLVQMIKTDVADYFEFTNISAGA